MDDEGRPPPVVAAVVAGAPGAGTQALSYIQGDGGTTILDQLALAAGESTRALEVILTAVHVDQMAMGSIHRLVIDHHDAEEIEQDVLIAVARSIGAYRGDSKFTTWLHSVARNVAIDFLRRRRETTSLDDNVESLSAAGRLSSMISTRSVLRDAIADLPVDYREAVMLRDVEHLSYREVADRLELNLNTVRSRIARGRALLAGHLGDRIDLGGSDGG